MLFLTTLLVGRARSECFLLVALSLRRVLYGEDPEIMAKRAEPLLVPINIDVEEDGYRVRDSFCWNLEGRHHYTLCNVMK